MKKILVLIITIFIITSCIGGNENNKNTVIDNNINGTVTIDDTINIPKVENQPNY